MIPPGGRLRYRVTPRPAGTRWYHTHTSAENDLSRASYTGQFGFLYIEPKYDSGSYDRELFLAIHHWKPALMRMGPPMNALDVEYRYATFNDRLFFAAEPIRVRFGERVLLHLLNASATRSVSLALPGHRFTVIAMDGNQVPQPRSVDTITLGVAERVDAIVEMNAPGVWLIGSMDARERQNGLARTIEYAGSRGKPIWIDPVDPTWSYLDFANEAKALPPAEEIPMTFAPLAASPDGLQRWTINGKPFPDTPPLRVKEGVRYRFVFVNPSGEAHPLHLHRHSFEVVRAPAGSVPA